MYRTTSTYKLMRLEDPQIRAQDCVGRLIVPEIEPHETIVSILVPETMAWFKNDVRKREIFGQPVVVPAPTRRPNAVPG